MPVFDFNNTPDTKEPVKCTYTTFASDADHASAEQPILILDNSKKEWKHHSCGVFANQNKQTAFEFDEEGGKVSADILRVDSRFVSLLKWLGENRINVRLSGVNNSEGYCVYRIREIAFGGGTKLSAEDGFLQFMIERLLASNAPAEDGFLQFMIERLLAGAAPEEGEIDEEEEESGDDMKLTSIQSITDFLNCAGRTLPDNIRLWARRNLAVARSHEVSPEERRHAQRALSMMLNIQWKKDYFEAIDPAEARRILDEELYGMEKVKQRIIETIIQINRTHTLPAYGITTTFVDVFNLEEVENAIQENTKAVYIETLGNPNSDVVDIEALAKIAHKHKIPLVVDNTFATPYLVRPIEYGADIVVHSATKFIGGHGTTIGGVIVESGKFDWEASGKFASLTEPNPSYHGVSFTKACGPAAFVTKIRAILLRDTGATISPVSSFIFLQGLETLSLRVERHVENALKVVQYLNDHPQVEKVHHPSVSTDPSQQELYKKYFPNGGGSIFTFEIKGDAQKAKDFIDNLELFSLLANVADVKSLVIHPATTTHSQCTEEELLDQGIKPNTIRLSIGTENIDDIIQDLDEAFKAVQ